jgi:hypothetical protein
MKSLGNWVFIEPSKNETKSGILTASMDRGTVIAYSDESLIDKEVLFDINRVAYKTSTFWIVDYQYVFGVVR